LADILVLEPLAYATNNWTELLAARGLNAVTLRTVEEAHMELSGTTIFLAMIDVRVPWKECSELLERMVTKDIPVLFTGCTDKNTAHVQSLYRGQCDVAEEGESTESILDRVDRLLRQQDRLLIVGALRMDVDKRSVFLRNELLTLTSQEFELLHEMMRKPDETLSREVLLRSAWGYQSIGVTRTVDVHVQRLRRKLGMERIETVPNCGYKLCSMP